MGDDTDASDQALEDLDYLTRSEHRVQVLEALTETLTKPGQDTPGYDPRELREVTGASEATVSRILTEFQNREWAERTTDGEYIATHQGQHVAVQVDPLLDSLETIQELGEDIATFPVTDLSMGLGDEVVSLQEFSDVTVHRPGAYEPTTLGEYLGDITRSGVKELFQVAFVAPSEYYSEAHEEMAPEIEVAEYVYAGNLIDWYSPEQRTEVRKDLERGHRMFRYEGHMPCQLFVFDETVLIENSQVEHIPPGAFIESQNETIREWAMELFKRYREASEELSPEYFAD